MKFMFMGVTADLHNDYDYHSHTFNAKICTGKVVITIVVVIASKYFSSSIS